VFNVADPSVVGGAILLVVLSLFGFDFDTVGRRRPGDEPETETVSEREAESS
jgi:signal peptidase II